jgi:DNA (cytosine-5)-methyltransferase 1
MAYGKSEKQFGNGFVQSENENVLFPEMRELHLFAGAGGGILGGILLGHTCVCAVEIEPYCRKVLLQRQRDGILPKFPIWDDIKTFDGKPWRGKVDVVCGGFPCQDISTAGKGGGIYGSRSGLWGEMSRVVCEVRPRFVFVENSPALVVRGLGRVLGDLAQMGFNARWGVFGTKDVGGHCNGKRIWIIAETAEGGWSEVVCRDTEINSETNHGRPTTDADTYSRLDRIRALESMAGQPAILGSNDGLANRVDRLHAIGNGQVPAVVKLAWHLNKVEATTA